jgi:hypothetical protein
MRLPIDREGRLDRGRLIHAWFEMVEWLDEAPPSDEALLATAAALATGHDARRLLPEFREALARPAVHALLSRATFEEPCPAGPEAVVHAGPQVKDPRWKVWRERSFAYRQGSMLLTGKIDRLVVLYDGQRPLGADVLDFKTDAVDPSQPRGIDARVEVYRPQLEAYRLAAARLVGLEPSQVCTRLVFTEAGVVRTLTAPRPTDRLVQKGLPLE